MPAATSAPARAWSLAIPVKQPLIAKSRLADVPHGRRRLLAAAFLADVLAAAGETTAVARILVIPARVGLNEDLRRGTASLPGPVAVLVADLPALTAGALASTLERCAAFPLACVPDRSGQGTVLLAAQRAELLAPHFGPHSAQRHAGLGAALISGAAAVLTSDVDDEDDLAHAVGLGVGPATAAALALTTPGWSAGTLVAAARNRRSHRDGAG